MRVDGAGSEYVGFGVNGGFIDGCGHQPVVADYSYCVTTFPYDATFAITATYGGDPSHAASTTTTQLAVTPASPDPVALAFGQVVHQLDCCSRSGSVPTDRLDLRAGSRAATAGGGRRRAD